MAILIITNSNPPKFLRKFLLVQEKDHRNKKTRDLNNQQSRMVRYFSKSIFSLHEGVPLPYGGTTEGMIFF